MQKTIGADVLSLIFVFYIPFVLLYSRLVSLNVTYVLFIKTRPYTYRKKNARDIMEDYILGHTLGSCIECFPYCKIESIYI